MSARGMTFPARSSDSSPQPWSTAPEALRLRGSVLQWLETMHVGQSPGAYRLNAGVSPTVFASCFAVYLRHLFDDLASLSADARHTWLGRILDHQDPRTGLFVDQGNQRRSPDALHDAAHLEWQLTTFCLSAVHALGGEPRYPLTCAAEWTADRTRTYLGSLDWANPWNSGNKAMFLGVVLSWDARHGSAASARALDAWFAWHDTNQNRSGFWGTRANAHWMDGMGGAFHQFLIYRYWQRPIARWREIVDRVLLLQQPDGLYSPWPSGATCYELDAADILVHAYHTDDYRRDDITGVLSRMQPGILSMQNPDGGFCWGRRRPFSPLGWMRIVGALARHRSPYYLYSSLRAAAAITLRSSPTLRTGWAEHARRWEESSVFDAWFRCLTLAEIGTVLSDSPFAGARWRFLEIPGLGWFPTRS